MTNIKWPFVKGWLKARLGVKCFIYLTLLSIIFLISQMKTWKSEMWSNVPKSNNKLCFRAEIQNQVFGIGSPPSLVIILYCLKLWANFTQLWRKTFLFHSLYCCFPNFSVRRIHLRYLLRTEIFLSCFQKFQFNEFRVIQICVLLPSILHGYDPPQVIWGSKVRNHVIFSKNKPFILPGIFFHFLFSLPTELYMSIPSQSHFHPS